MIIIKGRQPDHLLSTVDIIDGLTKTLKKSTFFGMSGFNNYSYPQLAHGKELFLNNLVKLKPFNSCLLSIGLGKLRIKK